VTTCPLCAGTPWWWYHLYMVDLCAQTAGLPSTPDAQGDFDEESYVDMSSLR